VNHVLENGSGKGIQAIIVYQMNALANSQFGELKKFLNHGYPDGRGPVTFRRYTGQEKDEQRKEIIANPPDIILTNYVMLELILTRPDEGGLVRAAQNLRFLVLDELHTYRGRQGSGEPWQRLGDLATGMLTLSAIDDHSIEGIKKKEQQYQELVRSNAYEFGRLWADSWCAAFVWKKSPNQPFDAITEDIFRMIERNPYSISAMMREEIRRLSDQYKFFHWHLALPDVFRVSLTEEAPENENMGWNGGFDVVLGNPPWERVKLQEKEWFAERNPDIASAPNAAARKRLIEALMAGDPALHEQFLDDSRRAEGESHLMRNSSRYPLCGRGDINTYAVFAEVMRALLSAAGRVGCVLPTGIATDDTTKFFFQNVVETGSLASLFDFENRRGLFPDVDSRMKFCLFTSGRGARPRGQAAEFVFFAHAVEDLHDPERRFMLYLPLYEAKMVDFFDHRAEHVVLSATATVRHGQPASLNETEHQQANTVPVPRSWVSDETVNNILNSNWRRQWYLSLRDITSSTNERTVIPSILPFSGVGNNLPLLFVDESLVGLVGHLLGCLSSLALDFTARFKVGGLHLNFFIVEQFPVIVPKTYEERCRWSSRVQNFRDWLLPRVLELTHTAWDLQPFAQDCGWSGPPFRWDEKRRFLLRCELDAAFFHLYLPAETNGEWRQSEGETAEDYTRLNASFPTPRDAVDYVMETFPIVKRKDIEKYGEYHPKQVILQIYDAMREAIQTGNPYQTLLDPPPADPSMSHSVSVNA